MTQLVQHQVIRILIVAMLLRLERRLDWQLLLFMVHEVLERVLLMVL